MFKRHWFRLIASVRIECALMHIYVYIYIYVCMYTYIYNMYVCTGIYIYINNVCMHLYVYIIMHTDTCNYIFSFPFMLNWPWHPHVCSVPRNINLEFSLANAKKGKMPRVVQNRLFGEKNTQVAWFPQFHALSGLHVAGHRCTMIFKWYKYLHCFCSPLSLSMNWFNMNDSHFKGANCANCTPLLELSSFIPISCHPR